MQGGQMRKDIRTRLLEEATKFHLWQELHFPGRKPDEICGEWADDYPEWVEIWQDFLKLLKQEKPDSCDDIFLDELLYLIARDNVAEHMIEELVEYPEWFEVLCRRAVHCEDSDARWQFATYLSQCQCNQDVKNLILDFASDFHEYVSRIALLYMPRLRPDCVEYFSVCFWEQTGFSNDAQLCRRLVVLDVLREIHSRLLPKYLRLARQDGRKPLLAYVEKIEKEEV